MMNKLELMRFRLKTQRDYHIPGDKTPHYMMRKRNAIFLNPTNTIEHEMEKCKKCYEILKEKQQFITEACRNSDKHRIDIVVLDTGEEIEIVHKHREASVLKRYEDEKVTVIDIGNEKLKKRVRQ
jgi:RNAse (barnase) inhibitor barstar